MLLENRNLEPGTVLVARYKKQDRTCEVVQTEEGLRYRLDDGSEHKSQAVYRPAAGGWRLGARAVQLQGAVLQHDARAVRKRGHRGRWAEPVRVCARQPAALY